MRELPTQAELEDYICENGHYAIKQMFLELNDGGGVKGVKPCFTLKNREHKGYPSAYEVYMSSVDEYDAALKLAPNMRVWDKMLESEWFMNGMDQRSFDGVSAWREHMRLRDASLAKRVLLEKASDNDVSAAKALLGEVKVKKPVGRANKKTKAELASVSRIKEFKKLNKKRG